MRAWYALGVVVCLGIDPVNPTQILFCPATCDYVQMSTEGKVTVKFGCETLVGPAE